MSDLRHRIANPLTIARGQCELEKERAVERRDVITEHKMKLAIDAIDRAVKELDVFLACELEAAREL